MVHLGDITKMNGAEIPAVDCVTFGAPCQDLSVAGKRAGMKSSLNGDEETTRSGLFFDAIRVMKEMRDHDRANGRTGIMVRCRYGIYENVPGAFSSNGGRDFQAVLTELVRVAEPTAPDVPMPERGGWSKSGFLFDEMGKWSVAWRLTDAQYNGTPQRRKRLCVLADFNGVTAGEILFDPQLERTTEGGQPISAIGGFGGKRGSEISSQPEGLSGDLEPGGAAREEAAGAVGGGAEGASKCYGLDHVMLSGGTTYQGRGYYNDVSGCLKTQAHGVMQSASIGVDTYNHALTGDIACTLSATGAGDPTKSGPSVLCLNDQGGSVMGVSVDVTGALRAQEHGHQPVVAGFSFGQSEKARGIGYEEEVSPTLRGGEGGNQKPVALIAAVDCRNGRENAEVNGTLQAKSTGGQSLNLNNVVRETRWESEP